MPWASPTITCAGVTHRYPGADRPAVDGISFQAAGGSLTVLLGPSGSGKTTLLKMINRLVETDAGKISIGGVEINDMPAPQLRRRIGYVIQQVGLFPHMTVEQNIAVVPRLEGWPGEKIRQRVVDLLRMVDLPEGYLRRYPRQLSGGEQQRVGLARALAADPGILLMDEPFGALDAITRKNLQDQLLHIQRQVGKTVLFVTHDVEEAIKLGDQILILHNGRLAQAGTPLEILLHPRDAFVAELVGSDNLLRRLRLMTAADILANREPDCCSQAEPAGLLERPVVGSDADLRHVLEVMLRTGAQQVVVTGEAGRPVGVIDFRDLSAALE